MSIIAILGTVALDTIKTPFGTVKDALGGSATYAAFAASFFSECGIISIVGKDLPEKYLELLRNRHIGLEGLEVKGKTFRWSGKYEFTMEEAETVETHLNCLNHFSGNVPDAMKNAKFLFLANTDPSIQMKVLDQMIGPKLVVLDTMNFWIDSKKKELLDAIRRSNILLLNEGEARQLFETPNLVSAAKKALALGPTYVIIKKGEHGALMFDNVHHFSAPSYPLENIVDPTGAGDSFGGALVGYIAQTDDVNERTVRKAMIYATAIASFNAEGFGLEKLKKLTLEDIERRILELKQMREW